ncbi:MAG: holo-ACP synthase [Patescibacteria group bacterium]
MVSKKLGIGVDIESISRFQKLNFNKNKNFYERIFNKNEIRYCLSKKDSSQHFAARFCAKEAFIKAVSKTIKDHKDIEVKVKNNKPFIVWDKKKYLLSLSHEKDKAIAFVIVKNE